MAPNHNCNGLIHNGAEFVWCDKPGKHSVSVYTFCDSCFTYLATMSKEKRVLTNQSEGN